MNVDVNKLKSSFTNKVNEMYTKDNYFVEMCHKFPSKYTLEQEVMDLSLKIFFEENNIIHLGGKCLPYCTVGTKRKIKLKSISDELESPDINIVNNYVVEDKWEQIDW